MVIKDLTLGTPSENILYDEVLLDLAEKGMGSEVLRFWESPEYFLVLGRTSSLKEDLKTNAVLRDRIPVLRRSSGGGTVIQGQGCLNFTFIFSKARDRRVESIKGSYEYILGFVQQALKECGMDSRFYPTCDLAFDGRKVSGNAQKRGKKFVLHHGTILYNLNPQVMERYLTIPQVVPEYRQGRDHRDFVTNLSIEPEFFKRVLIKMMGGIMPGEQISTQESKVLADLLARKNPVVDMKEALEPGCSIP